MAESGRRAVVLLSEEETNGETLAPSTRGADRTCPIVTLAVSTESPTENEREANGTPQPVVGLQASPTTCPATAPSTSRFIRHGRLGPRIAQASPVPLTTAPGVDRRPTTSATIIVFRRCLDVGLKRMRLADAGSVTLGMAAVSVATKMHAPSPAISVAVVCRLYAEI